MLNESLKISVPRNSAGKPYTGSVKINMNRVKNKNTVKDPVTIENNYVPTVIINRDQPQRRQGKYQLLELIKDVDISCGEHISDTVTFGDLLAKIHEHFFLEQYRKSLLFAFQYKRNFYIKKLSEQSVQQADERTTSSIEMMTELIKILDNKIIQYNESNYETLNLIHNNLSSGINDPIDGLNSLIGMDEIKNMIAIQIISFSKNPMTFLNKFNNFALYGPSGVGKTKVGKCIAWFYSKAGILIKDLFVIVTASKVISSFVGKTPQVMNSLLEKTLDGVLFIDEAYSITKSTSERNIGLSGHGTEAIDEMVGFIDKNIGMSIIIIAGYQDRMEKDFMSVNEGLKRRFPNLIILKPYSTEQLTDLLIRFLWQSFCEKMSDSESDMLYSIINLICKKYPDIFKNQAGDMLLLSNNIMEAIYGSTKSWISGDINSFCSIVLTGINIYLSKQGKHITININ